MPDLEPITRDEMLWSGEDVEPITRREMYIRHLYDETQVIPDKPITREEMFILKAGEELHDVTIEQLTATENKTYSEEGVAYSPVIVNVPQTTLTTLDVTENGTYTAPSGTAYNEVEVDVPLPENAYLLKDIPNTPCDIATFTDGSNLPMPSLKVGIEPIQSGSGDPSPTNIRPISGWDEANVTRTGKNLFDKNTVTYETGFITTTGEVSTSINGYQHTSFIKVNPNTDYVFSGDIIGSNLVNAVAFYDSKKEFISRFAPSANTPASFTTPSSCKYIRTNVYADKDVDTIQLEQGTTATAFEEFGITYTIPFTDSQGNPIEVFGGECDVVNGTSGNIEDRKKIVFDGSSDENWQKSSSGNMYYLTLNPTTFPYVKNHLTYNMANSYKFKGFTTSGYFAFLNDGEYLLYDYQTGQTAREIAVKNLSISTVEDFKTSLANNPLEIVYELATPSTFTSQPTSIKSLEGNNNVWGDCGQISEGSYFAKN